jgi:hypothetical protein
VVACEFYSAVLILTVPEQTEQTGWCVFYHFAKEVAVGGFFWGVLFFCSDSPPFRTITHSRFVPLYRYIRSGVAFLLEPFILLLCFLWFQNNQKKRTNPNGGWCGGAGTVYSAVPFCGVQNNQNKRVAGE